MSLNSVEEREYITHVPYASVIDSLMYAMMCTKPICHKLSLWLEDTCMIQAGGHGRQ